jgi:hypothetical protein
VAASCQCGTLGSSSAPQQTTASKHTLPDCTCQWLDAGTPIQNDLSEFHAVFDLACPGLLGNLNLFRKTYEGPIQRGRDADATDKQVRTWVVVGHGGGSSCMLGGYTDSADGMAQCLATRAHGPYWRLFNPWQPLEATELVVSAQPAAGRLVSALQPQRRHGCHCQHSTCNNLG